MTEQQKKDAIEYIEGQLENGYIDLSLQDPNELEIVKEAMDLFIWLEKIKDYIA